MMMTTKTKIIIIFLIAIFVAIGSNIILFRRVAIKSSSLQSLSEHIPQQQSQNQELMLPLQPPYYIVQHGSVRSGSTFQSQLLMAIIELKSKQQQQQHDVVLKPNYYMNSLDPNYRIKTNKEKTKGSPNSENYLGTNYFQTAIRNGFVVKTHKLSWVQKLLTTFTNMTTNMTTTTILNDEHGSVRSGSTFQSQLLMAIIELKSKQQQQQHDVVLKPNYYMNSLDPDYRSKTNKEKTKGSPNSENYLGTNYFQTAIRHGFVVKTHKLSWVQKLLTTFTNMTTNMMTTILNNDDGHENEQHQYQQRKSRRQVAIFVSREAEDDDDILLSSNNTSTSENKDSSSYSSSTSNNIVLIQTYKDLLNCSLCTIDLYQPIFDLSNDDILFLKNYMSKYETLRRCCGYQMSKYERLRLHGCNVTQYQQQNQTHHYDYPWCENYNLTKIELEFTYNSQNIKYHSGELERKINWNQPGDCLYYRNEIQYNNKDFNGRPWNKNIYGCDMNIIDSSKSQNKIRKTKRKENNIFEKEQRELDRDSAREQRELDRGTKLERLKKQTFQKNQQRQHQQQQLLLLQQQQP